MITPKTTQEWYDQLESWVPSWFFEALGTNRAHFWGLAALLSSHEAGAIKKLEDTFIEKATGRFLDHLGLERGIERLPGESDELYRLRIKNIFSQVDKPSIQAVVEAIAGPLSLVQEYHEAHNFANSGAYANIGHLFLEDRYNHFWVFIDRIENLFPPASYMEVDAFLDSATFLVDNDFDWEIDPGDGEANFQDIFDAINAVRAAGVRFVLVERQDLNE